jgi:hypothetical protein
VYVGQTGRDSKTRHKEHIDDIKSNKDKSRYALHILQENHEYGPTEKIMNILKLQNKVRHLDVYERFYIYKANKQNIIMKEQNVEVNNVLFDLITVYDKFKRYVFSDRSSLPGKSTNCNIKEASTSVHHCSTLIYHRPMRCVIALTK